MTKFKLVKYDYITALQVIDGENAVEIHGVVLTAWFQDGRVKLSLNHGIEVSCPLANLEYEDRSGK